MCVQIPENFHRLRLESTAWNPESKRVLDSLTFPYVQWPSNCLSRNPFVTSQGSYRPWKSWKVMEFKNFMFKSWKVIEFQLSVLDSHGN